MAECSDSESRLVWIENDDDKNNARLPNKTDIQD